MGQGFSYKCNNCDYTLEYMQGIGYLYPLEADKMLMEMKQGKFGKRFMEAANKATAPKVEFSRELYRCGKCDELRPNLKIVLYDDGKVIASKRQVCSKCHRQMSVVKSNRDLKCPKCKSTLVIGNMIMWD